MGTFKEIVNKILTLEQKEHFAKAFKFETPIIEPNNQPVPPVAKLQAEDTLEDGTVIKSDTDSFIVGSIVMVVTPEGELPAPDGELKLSNGNVITVEKGIITDVKVAEIAPEGAEPIAPSVTPEQMADMKADYDNKLEDSAKIISALLSKFTSQEKETNELKAKFELFSKEFSNLLNLPIDEPVKQEQKFTNKKERPISIFKK